METVKGKEELIRKYRLAGRIRFLSFSLLLLFLILMKLYGGYSYLSSVFIALIFVEAIINQPYGFVLKRVNVQRFQYYQMLTDIIAISTVLYYMGGLNAPVISIAYYAIILWAGTVSTTRAVFFAVMASSLFFSCAVLFEYTGLFPHLSFGESKMSSERMVSLLAGNISFFFAFGYFSAYSSRVIKFLERKRQEDSVRQTHKFLAAGHLVSGFAHDILNYLLSIRGYVRMLLDAVSPKSEEHKHIGTIDRLERKSTELLYKLAQFSKTAQHDFEPTDIHQTIEDALALTWPLARTSHIAIEKAFSKDILQVMADKEQLQEVFVALILNALDTPAPTGRLIIATGYTKKNDAVEITFSDTAGSLRGKDVWEDPSLALREEGGGGLGLTTAYGIIYRHKGSMRIKSLRGKGATCTIQLPAITNVTA